MATACTKLEVLEIAGTGVTDSAIHHISRGAPDITRLNLSECHSINDGSMATIAACLRKLEWVSVVGCKKLTDSGTSKLTAKAVISSVLFAHDKQD